MGPRSMHGPDTGQLGCSVQRWDNAGGEAPAGSKHRTVAVSRLSAISVIILALYRIDDIDRWLETVWPMLRSSWMFQLESFEVRACSTALCSKCL